MAFRAYDPCFACATHNAIGEMPLKVEIYNNKEQLIKNYQLFEKTCQENFNENFEICFSTKTNTNQEVLKTLSKEM